MCAEFSKIGVSALMGKTRFSILIKNETLNTDSPNVNKSSKKLTAYSKAILLNF